jgi:dephospho-CoA kinase
MLTRPFTRLVVAFGVRKITQRRLVEEFVIGILLLIPFGFVIGLLTSRICTKFKLQRRFIRSDIWTTLVVFLVGDVLMEWLLPSLSCLPMLGGTEDEEYTLREDEYMYNMTWILQSFGLWCPPNFASSESLLSPDATAILFSLRLVFLCLGVHVGESLCFVALTGGIATGKTTVARMFVDYNTDYDTSFSGQAGSGSNGIKRKAKKAAAATASNTSNSGSNTSGSSTPPAAEDGYKEGTVYLICADMIAHEVILPPDILARGKHEAEDDEDEAVDVDGGDNAYNNETGYLIHPSDSVYPNIVKAFQGKDILSSNGQIDRLKLGSIIFANEQQRRILNSITHPRILMILVRNLLKAVFFGSSDIVMADVPLLFESGKLSWLFGVTICVTTDPHVQLQRLIKRNPELSKEECQARIDSQMSLEKKIQKADIVIDNTGNLEALNDQVEEVRKDLMGRLYGIGMSLLQMLLLIGGSTSIAVSSKFYTHWQ